MHAADPASCSLSDMAASSNRRQRAERDPLRSILVPPSCRRHPCHPAPTSGKCQLGDMTVTSIQRKIGWHFAPVFRYLDTRRRRRAGNSWIYRKVPANPDTADESATYALSGPAPTRTPGGDTTAKAKVSPLCARVAIASADAGLLPTYRRACLVQLDRRRCRLQPPCTRLTPGLIRGTLLSRSHVCADRVAGCLHALPQEKIRSGARARRLRVRTGRRPRRCNLNPHGTGPRSLIRHARAGFRGASATSRSAGRMSGSNRCRSPGRCRRNWK